jgi:hypothetical protein
VRQNRGRGLSPFHILLTRFYMELALLSAGCAMFPPLLATWDMDAVWIWRLSNGVVVGAIWLVLWTYPKRRRAALAEPLPPRVWLALFISSACALVCVASAIGLVAPGPGPVALGATYLLFRACRSFESDLFPMFFEKD